MSPRPHPSLHSQMQSVARSLKESTRRVNDSKRQTQRGGTCLCPLASKTTECAFETTTALSAPAARWIAAHSSDLGKATGSWRLSVKLQLCDHDVKDAL